MLVLSFGFSKTSDAVQQICYNCLTTCGNGCSYSYTICGDSVADCLDKIIRAENALCGN